MKASSTHSKKPASVAVAPAKANKTEGVAKKNPKVVAAPSPKTAATKKTTSKTDSEGKTTTKKKATQPATKKRILKKAISFDKKITERLKKIVANYTEHPELLDNIERDTTKSFIDELNIDSVDFVEIIVDVEQAFNITIEDEEIYDLKSFEDLYLAIETKIKVAKK